MPKDVCPREPQRGNAKNPATLRHRVALMTASGFPSTVTALASMPLYVKVSSQSQPTSAMRPPSCRSHGVRSAPKLLICQRFRLSSAIIASRSNHSTRHHAV